jgi:drug/metabolite transporter (DMT)-like permease
MKRAVTSTPRRTSLWLPWLLLVIVATVCQVAMKLAGDAAGAFVPSLASLHAAAATPWLWLAVACYLGEFLLWMAILEKSALSAAFPASAITYVSVMVASWAVLGEPMDWEKIAGSVIIVAGILLLGSERRASAAWEIGHGADRRTQ